MKWSSFEDAEEDGDVVAAAESSRLCWETATPIYWRVALMGCGFSLCESHEDLAPPDDVFGTIDEAKAEAERLDAAIRDVGYLKMVIDSDDA